MKKKLKEMLLFLKYGYKATSNTYKKFLIKKGIKIGKETFFHSPWTIQVDTQRPWMIEIGDNVCVTAGVTILQHGYDWCVIQKKYGEVLGSCGKVKIGNNVFIGVNTTILKGVTVGDNVIIGANSLVNKNLKSNSVYAGNPATYLMSLDEYKEKREKKQQEEAVELINEYYNKNNVYPPKELLREFFWLFQDRNEKICETFENVIELGDNKEMTLEKFKNTKPKYSNYQELIDFVKKQKKNGRK